MRYKTCGKVLAQQYKKVKTRKKLRKQDVSNRKIKCMPLLFTAPTGRTVHVFKHLSSVLFDMKSTAGTYNQMSSCYAQSLDGLWPKQVLGSALLAYLKVQEPFRGVVHKPGKKVKYS